MKSHLNSTNQATNGLSCQESPLSPVAVSRKKRLSGFTLVELIVVISILAILGTIGFVSIQSYSSKSRDSVRVSTLSLATKALETYQVTAGKYPTPDSISGTGQIGGVTVALSGYLGDSAASLVKLDRAPLDPLSKGKYVYGTDVNQSQYQIATTVENSYALTLPSTPTEHLVHAGALLGEAMLPTAHAAASYEARVSGNYRWIIKVGNTLYNPPSLIVANQGTVDLANTTTRMIIHKGANLPYLIGDATQGAETPSDSLAKIGNSASTLTGIALTDWKTQSGTLAISLFGTGSKEAIDRLGTAYYGETKYYTTVAIGNGGTETPASTTFSLSATSVTVGTSVTISDTCTTHPTGYTSSNTSVATVSGTTITTLTTGTTNITPTGGNCSDSTTKTLTVTAAPITDWRSVDSNCGKADVTVGSQVWAGCNSTIGSIAIAYNQTNCYDYAGNTMTCTTPPGGKTVSSMTEADYKSGQSNNIYGALYQYDQMSSSSCLGTGISAGNTACPCKAGYHVPSQAEWDALETALGCSGADKFTGDTTGWECMTNTSDTTNGLGWTSTNPNSLKNRLGLTLAGYCFGGSCYNRGNNANYWSSSVYSPSPTSSWRRPMYWSYAAVNRNYSAQTYAFSVRCLKD